MDYPMGNMAMKPGDPFTMAPTADLTTAVELATTCCSQLKDAPGLVDKVYFPDTEAYQDRLESYWSVSAALTPWCMVVPSATEDVSTAVAIIAAENCPFGIRGGGHSAHPLSNGVHHGVTIDLGHMNGTTWNPDTRLASIQPGGHWQAVYDELAPHGVLVAGARAGTVGTGGFISGGGNSFYSASHGMACDTVENFEVVLANGSVVNANESSNPDLWQALKGGSGNLGIITRFDMHAIDYVDPSNPQIWGGSLFYDLSSGPAVIDALVEFTDNVHRDENSSSIVYWVHNPTVLRETILNVAIDNTLAVEKPPAFDSYYAVDGIYDDTTRLDSLSAIANELGAGHPPGFRNVWFTASFKNDARPINYAVEKFNRLNRELEAVTPSPESAFYTFCMFQPITKSIVDKSIRNGGNVIGLDKHIDGGNGIMLLLAVGLHGAEAEEQAEPLLSGLINDLEAYSTSLGLNWGWKYINYAHWSQDALSSFGEEAIELLQRVSTKFDPNKVFQELRTSGFKIPSKG